MLPGFARMKMARPRSASSEAPRFSCPEALRKRPPSFWPAKQGPRPVAAPETENGSDQPFPNRPRAMSGACGFHCKPSFDWSSRRALARWSQMKFAASYSLGRSFTGCMKRAARQWRFGWLSARSPESHFLSLRRCSSRGSSSSYRSDPDIERPIPMAKGRLRFICRSWTEALHGRYAGETHLWLYRAGGDFVERRHGQRPAQAHDLLQGRSGPTGAAAPAATAAARPDPGMPRVANHSASD